MKLQTTQNAPGDECAGMVLRTLFREDIIAVGRTTFGTVSIKSGGRLPSVGESAHDQDEYALILRGCLQICVGGQTYQVETGTATFIPAGEPHFVENTGQDEAEVVWALVRR